MIDPQVLGILAEQGITELYPPQVEALPYALRGESLVLAMPTASGKSLVAYLAMINSVGRGGKALYITPLRAVAAEKFEELRPFGRLGIRIGLAMGDLDMPDLRLGTHDIIIATSEKADSLLRHQSRWFQQLTVVVADEVHLINDAGRGPTLEVTLARIKQVNPKAQVLALSATIPNAWELADWLGAKHLQSDWRPVPLKEGIYADGAIHYMDGSERALGGVGDPLCSLVIDTLSSGGQVLVFVGTRKSAESLAGRLRRPVAPYLTPNAKEELAMMAQKITGLTGSRLADCLSGGTAFHHAGLTNEQRRVVESGFRAGRIKVVVATPTLAAGINMPARRVIVRDVWRYDSNVGRVPIPVLEVRQMAGRAGRPHYDREGEALLIARTERERDWLVDRYLLGEVEEIRSKLGAEPALRMHLLSSIATDFVSDRAGIDEFLGQTFFAYHGDEWLLSELVDRTLEFLEQGELIRGDAQGVRATPFGRRVSQLYIDPASAIKLREALQAAGEREMVTPFGLLHAISTTPDIPLLYLRAGDGWVGEALSEREDELLFPITHGDEWFLAAGKTALLLDAWVGEVSEENIEKRFNVYPGDLRRIVDTAQWLVYAARELGRLFHLGSIREMTHLVTRVRYGIKDELIPLVRLKGVGRIRGRSLFNAGYRTLGDLREGSVTAIASIPGIGSGLAEKIKEQV